MIEYCGSLIATHVVGEGDDDVGAIRYSPQTPVTAFIPFQRHAGGLSRGWFIKQRRWIVMG